MHQSFIATLVAHISSLFSYCNKRYLIKLMRLCFRLNGLEINSKKLGVKYENYNRVAASVFNERVKCENLKTWFRSTMSQKSELQSNQLTVDISCPLIKVANEFVNNQPTPQQFFGIFTDIFSI